MNKNQKGFTAIEGLLILIIVGMVGITGGYVWHSKKAADNIYNRTSTQKSPGINKVVASAAPSYSYAGWKTFCSSLTNACFKYGLGWTFAECAPAQINMQFFQQCGDSNGNTGEIESVSLIGPDDTRIDWSVGPYNASATDICTQGKTSYPGVIYSDITSVPSTSNLFFVNVYESQSGVFHQALTTGHNGMPPTVEQPGALCPPVPYFLSRDNNYTVSFNTSYVVNTNPKLPESEKSFPPAQSVLDTVKQTLLSFYYK